MLLGIAAHFATSCAVQDLFTSSCASLLQYTDVYWQFDPYAACNFQWFLKHANIILNPQEVVSGLQQAIEHIQFFRKQHDDTGLYFQVMESLQKWPIFLASNRALCSCPLL